MADPPPEDNDTHSRNGSLQISLPTVICTPESSVNSDTLCKTRTFVSSESKLSLPSNLGTPTSPLRLSSPLSLPTSPTPYMKITQSQPEKPVTAAGQMNSSPTTIVQQTGPNLPLVNTGSATVQNDTKKNFAIIQTQLDKLVELLEKQSSKVSNNHGLNMTEEDSMFNITKIGNVKFPMETKDEMDHLERKLLEKDVMKNLVKKLSETCGTSGTAKICKIGLPLMKCLITDELLNQFTWKGIKGSSKMAFVQYVKIRELFYKVAHLADTSCSFNDSDSFIQHSAIKHSGQRMKRRISSSENKMNVKKTKKETNNNEKDKSKIDEEKSECRGLKTNKESTDDNCREKVDYLNALELQTIDDDDCGLKNKKESTDDNCREVNKENVDYLNAKKLQTFDNGCREVNKQNIDSFNAEKQQKFDVDCHGLKDNKEILDEYSSDVNDEITDTSNTLKLQESTIKTIVKEAGNPRNKCALQPGHSLMDWIRLGNSGKDLTGVGGRMRPVSPEELATHNTQNDAWLAIRGRVYNITHYLPYHPGGAEELMRGAGIDATQLFDKVHPWVNYDSLLAKCLVGPLRLERPDAEELFGPSTPSPKTENRLREPSKAQELVRKSMENLANCITPVRKKISAKSEESVKGSPPSKIMQSLIQSSDLPVSISRRAAASPVKTSDKSDVAPSPLRFDWIQTSTKLTLSVYTGALANPGGCARIIEGILFIEVATNGWVRTLKLTPEAELQDSLQLRVFAESGKIEVVALKAEADVWKGCGEAVAGAASRVSTPRSVSCRVARVSRVSHDTVLLSLAAPAQALVAPLGHHVRVHRTIDDLECVRSYTPVGEGWVPDGERDSAIHLAVKGYETGALSPHLTALQPGDEVTVSGPYGNFELHKLKGVKEIYFVAAGTGITPMLGLLKFMLPRSNPRCERIHLLFFNKTEDDILFRENFEEIAREDDRFSVTHVLSDASTSWSGHRGRVTASLLTQVIGKDSLKCKEQCTHFACVCGPTEFTHTTIDLLKKHMKYSCIHAFMG